MADVKCRICKKKIPKEMAYKVEHITSGGNKQNHYYCSREEFEEVEREKDFVKENVNPNVTDEDVEFYSEMLDDITLEVDNDTKLLDEHNRPSLIALVGYACQNEIDDKLVEWIKSFFVNNTMYILNQKENFIHMKNSLQKMAVA